MRIIFYKTTDITNMCEEVCIVFRYVESPGSFRKDVLHLLISVKIVQPATHVCDALTKYQCEGKLVAQTYDEAAGMSGERRDVQALVESRCTQAIFIHCYALKMNLVLKNFVDDVKKYKICLTRYLV